MTLLPIGKELNAGRLLVTVFLHCSIATFIFFPNIGFQKRFKSRDLQYATPKPLGPDYKAVIEDLNKIIINYASAEGRL